MKILYCSKFSSYRYVLYSSLKLMAAHSVLVCRNLHLVNLSLVEKVSLHPTSSGGLEFEAKLIQAPKFILHWGLVASWKKGAYWFASHDFLSLLYCTTKNHLPRVGNCPLWNEPSYIHHQSSIVNEENSSQTYIQANPMEAFSIQYSSSQRTISCVKLALDKITSLLSGPISSAREIYYSL